jgi:hypothetical protein
VGGERAPGQGKEGPAPPSCGRREWGRRPARVICATACREDARRRGWGGPAAEGAEELKDRVHTGEVDAAREGGRQGSSARRQGGRGRGSAGGDVGVRGWGGNQVGTRKKPGSRPANPAASAWRSYPVPPLRRSRERDRGGRRLPTLAGLDPVADRQREGGGGGAMRRWRRRRASTPHRWREGGGGGGGGA